MVFRSCVFEPTPWAGANQETWSSPGVGNEGKGFLFFSSEDFSFYPRLLKGGGTKGVFFPKRFFPHHLLTAHDT